MKLFLLSKENLALSRAEAERLHQATGELDGDLLFLDVDEWRGGLAFTREIHELLIEAGEERLAEAAAEFPWEEHVELPYAVDGRGLVDEQAFAGYIWRRLDAAGRVPKVNLERPRTRVTIFVGAGRLLVTTRLWKNEERFFDRRAHLRPRNHPTSLNPKLARAMINLAGPSESILDPFCGAGGILLEGALAGRSMSGVDIDPRQVARAEENLIEYGVGAALTVGDAAECDTLTPVDAIVTDLPLGKNAVLHEAERTFAAFFDAAARITRRIVVAFDADCDIAVLFEKNWRVVGSFDWLVHKGMVKRLYLLTRAS